MKARSLDQGELDDAEELLRQAGGDVARAKLAELGGIDPASLKFGDGWAASLELDGTTLFVRGEPAGEKPAFSIYSKPNTEGAMHAAHKLQALLSDAP